MFWHAALAVVHFAVAQAASAQGAVALRTVTDMSGRAVPLPAQVRRIGCLEVLCYEKLFLLGASDRIAMMVQTNAPWMEPTNPAMRRIQKIGSEPNVEELLREASAGRRTSRWRHINHIDAAGRDIPILFSLIRVGDSGQMVAVGRDLRVVASLQARLLATCRAVARQGERDAAPDILAGAGDQRDFALQGKGHANSSRDPAGP